MRIKHLPAGFVIPAQPVLALRPPSGADWVHEIKHDGYRLIVRRDGPTVRLYSRNAFDWTARLTAIAAAAERIKAKSFTIDGDAVVLGPDGFASVDKGRDPCVGGRAAKQKRPALRRRGALTRGCGSQSKATPRRDRDAERDRPTAQHAGAGRGQPGLRSSKLVSAVGIQFDVHERAV